MSTSQQIREAIFKASKIEKKKVEKTAEQTASPLESIITDESPAQEELEAFSSDTDSTHEEMQKLRMNGMQVEMEKLQAEVERIRTASEGNQIDNSLRKHMAWMTFGFMVFWCVFVAVVFAAYMRANDRSPPPEVIIALLGTSTITIVGLVGFVVSGLFKSPKKKDEE